VAAQRAWIAFWDVECAYANGGPTGGGSIYPMLQLQCLTALTAARTDALAEYIICPGGDLSCTRP
jgi:uncharacterized protein YecT (DUF1311 family)